MKTLKKLFRKTADPSRTALRILPAGSRFAHARNSAKLFCLLAILCSLGAAAQNIVGPGYTHLQQVAGFPWQLAGDFEFNASSAASGGFDTRGIAYYRVTWYPVGTVNSCSLSIDSFTTVAPGTGAPVSPVIGGILPASTLGSCATANQYVTTTAAGMSPSGQITPTITGTGSVIVIIFGYTDNPAAGGNAPTANVVVTNTVPVTLATAPTTPTQIAGFSSMIGFQQAATASAVALATHSSHSFCLEALPTNTINVYAGPSGVTTSTGIPLQPGQTACWPLSNTNLVYVIASTTGASVAVTGT